MTLSPAELLGIKRILESVSRENSECNTALARLAFKYSLAIELEIKELEEASA